MRSSRRQAPQSQIFYRHRLAEPPSPLGAARSRPYYLYSNRLAVQASPPGAILVLCVVLVFLNSDSGTVTDCTLIIAPKLVVKLLQLITLAHKKFTCNQGSYV